MTKKQIKSCTDADRQKQVTIKLLETFTARYELIGHTKKAHLLECAFSREFFGQFN